MNDFFFLIFFSFFLSFFPSPPLSIYTYIILGGLNLKQRVIEDFVIISYYVYVFRFLDRERAFGWHYVREFFHLVSWLVDWMGDLIDWLIDWFR